MPCQIVSQGSSPLTRGKPDWRRRRPERAGLIPAHAGKTFGRMCRSTCSTAHPRSRGENADSIRSISPVGGSSPLTRGKPLEGLAGLLSGRLIPAHAGKTASCTGLTAPSWAHPRSRGENHHGADRRRSRRGSSPLTRGKLRRNRVDRIGLRLIPAHAGKTYADDVMHFGVPAHPRSRGENRITRTTRVIAAGSSPLTRGKLLRVEPLEVRGRLIPAHAGKTADSMADKLGLSGSSPLTRGKLCGIVTLQLKARLIPAHAGKTRSRRGSARISTAHPRSRGENLQALDVTERAWGSSPLTRGKRGRWIVETQTGGLIPAHAGKTGVQKIYKQMATAHPRSRGENASSYESGALGFGSSPLTRGKHFLTCAFTAQIDQILETLELAASFGSYLIWVACATDAPQDPVRSIGLVLPSSRGAS